MYAREEIFSNPIRSAVSVLAGASILVIGTSLAFYDSEFFEGVLVEAHGMLLDILVIGVFVLWLDLRRSKRIENRGYQNEIDDFRGWQSDEGKLRTMGNIKRLNANGVTFIDLHRCFLKEMDMRKLNLRGSFIQGADLGSTKLRGANLRQADLQGTYLGDADLVGVDLRSANLERAKCQRSVFQGANLRGASICRAKFWDANLYGADFRDSDLRGVRFGGASLREADLRGCKNLTVEQLVEASTLYGTDIDEPLLSEAKAMAPELFEFPTASSETNDDASSA